jgi:N-sulfoglucosamine sulfohydrolase
MNLINQRTNLLFISAIALCESVYGDNRPNILFAFADDMGRHNSIYNEIEGGDPFYSIIQTPNFDRIAREGALFMNAHVTAPQCTPCRSSILSGQYFWRTGRGAILQGAVWDESIPSYPLILKESGYHIGRSYKVWSPGTPADAPYGGPVDNAYQERGKKFNNFSLVVLKGDPGKEEIEERKQNLFDEVLGNFEDFLSDRKEGEPFCYWWGPMTTHRDWQQGSGKRIWNLDPDSLIGKMPDYFPDVPEIREDITDYLGECLAFDYGLGLLIQKLEEIGELDNTIIVVSGDHGFAFPRAKCNLYNVGTTVSLAMRYPAMIDSGRIIEDLVNLMDLAPTFLEIGELNIPDVMTSKSLIPILEAHGSGIIDSSRNYVVTGKERQLASARPGNLPYPQRAIIKLMDDGVQYKYIRNFCPERWPMGILEKGFPEGGPGPTKTWYVDNYCNEAYKYYMDLAVAKRPYEELYNLGIDPFELKNLAKDSTYLQLKNYLSSELDSVLIKTNDPRMVEGISVFDRLPYTIPN